MCHIIYYPIFPVHYNANLRLYFTNVNHFNPVQNNFRFVYRMAEGKPSWRRSDGRRPTPNYREASEIQTSKLTQLKLTQSQSQLSTCRPYQHFPVRTLVPFHHQQLTPINRSIRIQWVQIRLSIDSSFCWPLNDIYILPIMLIINTLISLILLAN